MERKNTRADIILSVALILGAIILAVVSWKLPSHIVAPMTADIRGTVEAVEPAYEETRMAIRLKDNSTRFTMPIGTFETLEQKPEMGDQIGLKYELTSYRDIRMLEIEDENGNDVVIYQSENPATARLQHTQNMAFIVFFVYAAACVVLYIVITRRKKT